MPKNIAHEIPSANTDGIKIKKTAMTRLKYSMIFTGFSMLFFMTVFEIIKEFLIPGISSWESHIITILFTSLFAILISYFILKKINQKNQELNKEILVRKNAEITLKAAEQKNRIWLESSPVWTKIVDLDFNLQYMSAAGIKGLNIDDITQFYGKPYPFDFYPESFKNSMTMNLKKVKETGEIIEQEGSVNDIEGNELWFHSTLVPVNDEKGQIDYIIVVSAEITDRKHAEERLNNIIEFLPDATFVIDQNKKVIAWNKALEIMTDTPKKNMIGKGEYSIPFYGEYRPVLADFVEKKEHIDIEKHYDFVEQQQNTLFAEIFMKKLYKGKGAYVWAISSPFYDKSGNFLGAIESVRDITERKKIEAELNKHRNHLEELVEERTIELQEEINNRKQVEQQRETLLEDLVRANSELKHFSYTVSHDLKAPLRGISSIVKWLSEDYSDSLDKKGHEYLDKLLLRTKRMHNLIEGILQYSRVGHTKTEPQQLDSKKIIQEISDNTTLPENITITIEEPLPVIKFDKILFIQVFQNLIENAVQHLGKPSGEIVVSYMDQGKNWEFCIKDNGVGIEEKHHDRIFKIFQSLKPHSAGGSTGLGLTLVKKIIENNGGKVRLESLIDKGSSFFITIPKELKPEIVEIAPTVLIIDDNIDFTKVAASMLQNGGYKVLNASTGPEACEIIETGPETISIVLFDLHIPGEDTLERFKILKQMKPDIKVIVCSGLTPEYNDFLTQVKVDGILTKPFTINEFNSIFMDILKKY